MIELLLMAMYMRQPPAPPVNVSERYVGRLVIAKQPSSLVFSGVTIHADGRVEFAPGVAPNEAAKQFAEALQGYVGWRWKCGDGGKP